MPNFRTKVINKWSVIVEWVQAVDRLSIIVNNFVHGAIETKFLLHLGIVIDPLDVVSGDEELASMVSDDGI